MCQTSASLDITPLPAFSDNYLWLLHQHGYALIVDPGDAECVEQALSQAKLTLAGILLTHHHADHVGGAAALQQHWQCPVFAPESPHPAYQTLQATRVVPGATLKLDHFPDMHCEVLGLPGHTLDHIAYYIDHKHLFSGDVLFGAGCGRLFEGTPAQMLDSLQSIARLPADTLIYPAHEYTLHNIAFALGIEPDNGALQHRASEAQALRAQGKPTLPTSLALERATNPFLRCDLLCHTPAFAGWSALQVFTELRARRNVF